MPAHPTFTPHHSPDGPLRGTQSLVGVMGFVWRHPSLTALELLGRWLAAVPLLAVGWFALRSELSAVPVDQMALASMTFLEPVRSASVLAHQVRLYLPVLGHTAGWWIPLAILVWTAVSTLGRAAVLRRADPTLTPRLPRLALTNFLRALSFLALLGLWLLGLAAAVHSTVTSPGQHGLEPNVVLLTAEAVGLTLAAFMLWSLSIWALDVQPLKAMTGAHLSRPGQFAELRSKLIETNLVMGIVRVALFVLAMTFSASPLPFQTRETQAYINVWWVGVGLFYVLSSDFFHVVRRITYLRLLQGIAAQVPDSARAFTSRDR